MIEGEGEGGVGETQVANKAKLHLEVYCPPYLRLGNRNICLFLLVILLIVS